MAVITIQYGLAPFRLLPDTDVSVRTLLEHPQKKGDMVYTQGCVMKHGCELDSVKS
jgi:hypothetical protein